MIFLDLPKRGNKEQMAEHACVKGQSYTGRCGVPPLEGVMEDASGGCSQGKAFLFLEFMSSFGQ